jgi:hypothetical protein
MPTKTDRAPRRGVGRRPAPRRRGIAGGWLQRRQPEPTGLGKAIATVKRAAPASRHGSLAAAAAGVAALGAAGLAYGRRNRTKGSTVAAP